MINWPFIRTALMGNVPAIRNMRLSADDVLFDLGLTMGTLIIGRPGTGKTSYLAKHLVEYLKKYRHRSAFVMDWSGSITNTILELIAMEPHEVRESLLGRLVYDELGNPDYVIPLPEFSPLYGSFEEQVQRVSENLVKLAPQLVSGAPFVAGQALKDIGPQMFRLLTAIQDDYDNCWQITEAKRLIVDLPLLKQVVSRYGHRSPEAKWFVEKIYAGLRSNERELRTYALTGILGAVEPLSTRARIGYPRPGWTPKSAIENGQIVLINGERLINQKSTQHYLFTQAYSLIMAEINKRTPGDPNDEPVSLVMDEVYSLLSIPGMAEDVGTIAPLYRSRKLQLYVVLQSLSQLAKPLDQQIWSLGNKVVFGVENKQEAEIIAYQLSNYNPHSTKLPALTSSQNPVSEPEHGQDRQFADCIQRFRFRECFMQRYKSEREREAYLSYIPQTSELNHALLTESVKDMKNRLLRSQGVPVRDALTIINNRKLPQATNNRPPQL